MVSRSHSILSLVRLGSRRLRRCQRGPRGVIETSDDSANSLGAAPVVIKERFVLAGVFGNAASDLHARRLFNATLCGDAFRLRTGGRWTISLLLVATCRPSR